MSKFLTTLKHSQKLWLPVLIVAVFLAGWYVGLPARSGGEPSGASDTTWTCSMHPQVRQPNPGLCPICAMDLIPLEPGGEGGLREIKVTPEAAALMDLRVSPVVREPAAIHLDLFGKIAYDERRVTTTTARVAGRLDRFFIDYTGTLVRKGDHIAEIYSPNLLVAQQDLIKAVQGLARAKNGGTAAAIRTQERLVQSARERLRLLQLADDQIDAIAKKETPSDHITIFARQDGIVTERHVVEGAYVKEGESLFSVASLESVWLNMEAYESDLPWLKFAQDVAFTVEAIPGEVFHGRIAYIDPEIDPMRRVVNVRVNVPNKRRLLKPGMFVRATVDARVAAGGKIVDDDLADKWISPMHPEVVRDAPGECPICGMPLVLGKELGFVRSSSGQIEQNPLLVPASSVLKTGKRATVYVRLTGSPEPKFEGREIMLGARVDEQYIVESGLSEGEMVVTRGAFKLDSELQLKAKPSMMNRNSGLTETPAAEADASLLGQWGAVPRALGRLESAVKASDQKAAHAAISDMGAAIDSVNTESFPGKALQGWREFSNRLKNALSDAHKAPAGELPITYRDLRHEIAEAGRYLGLPSEPVHATASIDGEKLKTLIEALKEYFALSKALAADDKDAAASAAERLAASLGALGIDGTALKASTDLSAKRKAFEPVSNALVAMVKEIGADRVGNVYVAHCPMAFDYEGADWLSPEPSILNPYFGEEMLTCGTVTENLSFDPKQAVRDSEKKSGAQHEHKH